MNIKKIVIILILVLSLFTILQSKAYAIDEIFSGARDFLNAR